jgi:hypothetical protein
MSTLLYVGLVLATVSCVAGYAAMLLSLAMELRLLAVLGVAVGVVLTFAAAVVHL